MMFANWFSHFFFFPKMAATFAVSTSTDCTLFDNEGWLPDGGSQALWIGFCFSRLREISCCWWSLLVIFNWWAMACPCDSMEESSTIDDMHRLIPWLWWILGVNICTYFALSSSGLVIFNWWAMAISIKHDATVSILCLHLAYILKSFIFVGCPCDSMKESSTIDDMPRLMPWYHTGIGSWQSTFVGFLISLFLNRIAGTVESS